MRRTRPSRPFRSFPATGLALALVLGVGLAAPARALERGPYSMEVLVGGVPLEELSSRGRTYVEALETREYSIRLTNHTRDRIAVAVAVDGLNSINAATTSAQAASKWILGAYESITLDGWQTGSDTARRFFFTTEDQSYGAWMGETANLGVISAAVFREIAPRPIHPRRFTETEDRRGDSGRRSVPRAEAAPREKSAPAPSTSADAEGQAGKLSDDLAATGIGREVDHRVRRVTFRAEATPAEVLEIRYEYRDALVALGVVPRRPRHESPLLRRERARGFADGSFAPDPFARPHRH